MSDINNFRSVEDILRCPSCHSSRLDMSDSDGECTIACGVCASRYSVSSGRPVLLRADNNVFNPHSYHPNSYHPNSYHTGKPIESSKTIRFLKKITPGASVNLSSKRLLSKLRCLLEDNASSTVLVVGGGCQRDWLNKRLNKCLNKRQRHDSSDHNQKGSIRIIYSDIDVHADVDLFCDGHDLPFKDGVFDAVITTAVLEHVLYPERVASEIVRVLKVGGLLYSELPFMQQVHEGAYDFTRYTMSGHRRLFNAICEIESGIVAGPGTALVWAIENFFLAFVPSSQMRKFAKVMVRFMFSWVKYFDLLLKNSPSALDAASCTYLFGRKAELRCSDNEIISNYSGAQKMRHT